MAEKNQISFAASAVMDLEDMQAYYSDEGALDVGKRLAAEIISRVERLQAHPLSGRVVPEFHVEHLREIIHPPFRSSIGTIKTKCALSEFGEVKEC